MYTQVRLEASSVCQLKCPSCPTTTGDTAKGMGLGILSVENFKKFLDLNPQVEEIELSNYGEIFLNKHLLHIMKLAYERRVRITAKNGVNLNLVSDDVLEGLVKYRFLYMSVSIDGASQETYSKYRVKGVFDKVIDNIVAINKFKALYKSRLPQLSWQFVVFGHNEHEINTARKMATELNMTFKPKMTWDEDFSPIKNAEKIKQDTGWKYASRSEALQLDEVEHNAHICNQLWDKPQINWDGRVLGCCVNYWGDFGVNAFEESLDVCLSGGAIEYGKNMVLGVSPPKEGIPCTTCDVYERTKSTGNFLVRNGVVNRISAVNIPSD